MSKWLISVEELAQCYQQPDTVLVDCRFSLADTAEGERHYQRGHIDGAHYLHLDRDLSGVKGQHGGRHPLPQTQDFVNRLQSIAVNPQTLVVAYDDHRFAFASRLLWLLRYIGHDHVKVLDGGFRAWSEASLPIASEIPVVKQRGTVVANIRPELVVDRDEITTNIDQSDCALIDAREHERYLGLREPIDPIAGHIQGAVNYPWQEVSNSEGFFCSADRQIQRWGELLHKKELVVYCGSGVTACVNLLSLAELGREDAKLYAGSWSDWCSYLPQGK
jgi:thiosulfate/3-mercaptopyruvate sulfurtransferase